MFKKVISLSLLLFPLLSLFAKHKTKAGVPPPPPPPGLGMIRHYLTDHTFEVFGLITIIAVGGYYLKKKL